MRLTDAQVEFTLEVQIVYETSTADECDMLPALFVAASNDEDLEIARLVGCMIVAIGAAGYDVADLAKRWIQFFEPCSSVH